MGHLVGDRLLIEVGRRLTTCARTVDTLARTGHDQVARIGGDEFVLLLEDIHHDIDAIRVAERVHQELAEPFPIDGQNVRTSASIGITGSDSRYKLAEDMLRDADTALIAPKQPGNHAPDGSIQRCTIWR